MPCQGIFSKCYIYGIWENVVLQNGHDYFPFSIETTIYSMKIHILQWWRRHFDANFDVHLWGSLPNVARLLAIFWDIIYHTKTKIVPSTSKFMIKKRVCKNWLLYMCTNLNMSVHWCNISSIGPRSLDVLLILFSSSDSHAVDILNISTVVLSSLFF
jgi:hypothetical protein